MTAMDTVAHDPTRHWYRLDELDAVVKQSGVMNGCVQGNLGLRRLKGVLLPLTQRSPLM
jgi:hypothetical protein